MEINFYPKERRAGEKLKCVKPVFTDVRPLQFCRTAKLLKKYLEPSSLEKGLRLALEEYKL